MNRESRILKLGSGRKPWFTKAGLLAAVSLLAVSLAGQVKEVPAGLADVPSTPQPAAESVTTRPGPERVQGYFIVPKVSRPELPSEVTQAFVIPIREEITESMADGIARKVVEAKARGAQMVIFDFETPGGEVWAAKRISAMIKHDLHDVRTVAFVNSEAISAGALLALACDEIVMTPNGKLGDAAPISMGGQLSGVEREKIETYLRTEFRDSAEAHGYSSALAEKMVSADLEIWLVRNVDTRELQYVRRDQWAGRVRVPPGVTSAPSNPEAQWEVLQVAVPEGKLLTMTTEEARQLGFVRAVVGGMDELQKLYNTAARPIYLGDTWSEKMVYFLTTPTATGILVLLAIFFGYIEMHTPGFGLAGTAAIICLALLFGSRLLIGLSSWWAIAVFALGLGLVIVELFVTPTFGILGIVGLFLCVAGLVASLIGNVPSTPALPEPGLMRDAFLDSLFAVCVGFVAACVLCILMARVLPKAPVAGRLVLASAPSALGAKPSTEDADLRRMQPGEQGVVESYCRPAGKARFGETLLDVMSEGEFLTPGTRVVVLRNEGNRLLVRRVTI